MDNRVIAALAASALILIGCESMDRSRTSNESASAPEATFHQAAGPGSRVKNIADARIPRKRASPSPSSVPGDESRRPDKIASSTIDPSKARTMSQPQDLVTGVSDVRNEPQDSNILAGPGRVAAPAVRITERAEAVQALNEPDGGGSPATEPAVLDKPEVASAAPDQYSDRPSHPLDPRAASGASDPKSEREAVTASNASPRIGLESQARLPPLRAPTGPSRIRTPLYSQGCACPFDIASGGQMCGSQSDWVRPGGFDPACYGDPWGETAIFACFVVQLGQILRNAPMSFCPRS